MEKDNRMYSLKELRARKNRTQKQVAADIGVSEQTYCAWEKDISNVAVSKVLAIAQDMQMLRRLHSIMVLI